MEVGTVSYATRDEEAAAILNLLDAVGLTGGKLAVCAGDENTLAQQVAMGLKITQQEWHVEFLKGQIQAAVQMEDLERRVAGSSSSASMQRVLDARDAKVADLVEPKEDSNLRLTTIPKKGALGKSVRLASGRVVADEEVSCQVLRTLIEELEMMRAPVMAEVKKTRDPVRAAKSLIGKYRLSTVRRYLASWQKFRKWFQTGARLGALPTGISLVDYLYMREDQGMEPPYPWRCIRRLAGSRQSEASVKMIGYWHTRWLQELSRS